MCGARDIAEFNADGGIQGPTWALAVITVTEKKQHQDDLSTVKFNSNKNTRGDGEVDLETKQGDRR